MKLEAKTRLLLAKPKFNAKKLAALIGEIMPAGTKINTTDRGGRSAKWKDATPGCEAHLNSIVEKAKKAGFVYNRNYGALNSYGHEKDACFDHPDGFSLTTSEHRDLGCSAVLSFSY